MLIEEENYEKGFEALKWICENKISLFSYTDLFEFVYSFKEFIYNQLHNVLVNNLDQESEKKRREYCKYVIAKLLPINKNEIERLNRKIVNNIMNTSDWELYNKWIDLNDDLMAIASYRSLYHFAVYLETQDPEENKVWKYTMDKTMGSIFYYAQSMILNHRYTNLIKQCPTGYGKSKSDCVIISFIFGYDINATVLKIVGNPSVIQGIFNGVVNMMKSVKYRKVFPQFKKYEKPDDIFSECKSTNGAFTLKDSQAGRSFYIANKETSLDGTRYNYQFYDDITQSKEKYNMQQHLKDRTNYLDQWSKRMYNENTVLRFITGTAYHQEDLISYLRRFYNDNYEYQVDLNAMKIFEWGKFCKLSLDQKTVYIAIQGLVNLELGEDKAYSSFPEKYSKDYFLKDYHNNYEMFMAMTQQTPMPAEALGFDWVRLKQYSKLPQEITKKVNECESYCIIDPSRKGKDYFCALILKKAKNDYYYLIDAFYKKATSKMALPEICKMCCNHMVDYIIYEENATDNDLFEENIKAQMKIYGWNKYNISSFYSCENKEDKIHNAQDEIRDLIYFPQKGMYYSTSQMGLALNDIVNYSFEGKNAHDDSIDCLAMFVNWLKNNQDNEMWFFHKGL